MDLRSRVFLDLNFWEFIATTDFPCSKSWLRGWVNDAIFSKIPHGLKLWSQLVEFSWNTNANAVIWLAEPLHTISHKCAVAWCAWQNWNVFLFLQTFESTFTDKWVIKFLRRLKGRHLQFLESKKLKIFERKWLALVHIKSGSLRRAKHQRSSGLFQVQSVC